MRFKGIYIGKRYRETGADSDRDIFEFKNIVLLDNNKKWGDGWLKKTKLLVYAELIKGKSYTIEIDNKFKRSEEEYFTDFKKFGKIEFPIEIFGSDGIIFRKKGGRILRIDKDGIITNLSVDTFRLS